MASMLENEDKLKGKLYDAILKEDVEKVKELCERFADHAMHRLTIHEDTVLHVATYSKQTGLVLRLLEALPHHHIHKITTSKNVSGNTVLHEVATLDDCSVEVATKILEKAPELLSMRNELGESVLFQSARYGKIKIFNFLADKISKYDEDTLKSLIQRNDKTTILHIAILAHQFGKSPRSCKVPAAGTKVEVYDCICISVIFFFPFFLLIWFVRGGTSVGFTYIIRFGSEYSKTVPTYSW